VTEPQTDLKDTPHVRPEADADIQDAHIVDSEPGTDLVHGSPAPPATLFRVDDPVEALREMARVADALKSVLRNQKLVKVISGREHVLVEGWTTLGSMLGVTPVCVKTAQIEQGWEATVEARTLDGRTIGRADAMCTRQEQLWKNRDEYALRSMAQVRATSKALKSVLGFVATLAGFEATPADEMPPEPTAPPYGPEVRDTSQTAFANALAWMHDSQNLHVHAGQLAARLTELYGYFPQVAANAVVLLAQQIKDGSPEEGGP
jgi:hypothetical protein